MGWVIWHVDQTLSRDLAQVKEWYADFPVKASACVECGTCVERCPFDLDIISMVNSAIKVQTEIRPAALRQGQRSVSGRSL